MIFSMQVGELVRRLENQVGSNDAAFNGQVSVGAVGETLQTLQYRVQLLGGRLTGTDFERSHLRRECFALITEFGPPTFFLTFNFAELHSPLAVYLAGHKLDLSLGDTDASSKSVPNSVLALQ